MLVPYLTTEQQKRLETVLAMLDLKIHDLSNEPVPPAGLESEQLMSRIADIRGRANEISGDCLRLMDAIRTLWRQNYPRPEAPPRAAARKASIDDLSF